MYWVACHARGWRCFKGPPVWSVRTAFGAAKARLRKESVEVLYLCVPKATHFCMDSSWVAIDIWYASSSLKCRRDRAERPQSTGVPESHASPPLLSRPVSRDSTSDYFNPRLYWAVWDRRSLCRAAYKPHLNRGLTIESLVCLSIVALCLQMFLS